MDERNIFKVENRGRPSPKPPASDLIVFNHIPKSAGGLMYNFLVPEGLESSADFRRIPYLNHALTAATKEMCREAPILHWGHSMYGYHDVLGLTATNATALRDPVERFISEYFWMAALPESQFAERPDLVFQEMLRDIDRLENANFQTYLFCEHNYLAPPWDHHTFVTSLAPGAPHFHVAKMAKYDVTSAYEKARANLLADFSFVGISELAAESLLVMADTYGWSHLANPGDPQQRINHASMRPAVDQLPIRTRRRLEKLTEADQSLYDEFRERFESQFAQADFGQTYRDLKDYLGIAEAASLYLERTAGQQRYIPSAAQREIAAHKELIAIQSNRIQELETRINVALSEKLKRELGLV